MSHLKLSKGKNGQHPEIVATIFLIYVFFSTEVFVFFVSNIMYMLACPSKGKLIFESDKTGYPPKVKHGSP